MSGEAEVGTAAAVVLLLPGVLVTGADTQVLDSGTLLAAVAAAGPVAVEGAAAAVGAAAAAAAAVSAVAPVAAAMAEYHSTGRSLGTLKRDRVCRVTWACRVSLETLRCG